MPAPTVFEREYPALQRKTQTREPLMMRNLDSVSYFPFGTAMKNYIKRRHPLLQEAMIYCQAANFYLQRHPRVIRDYRRLINERKYVDARTMLDIKYNFLFEHTLDVSVDIEESVETASNVDFRFDEATKENFSQAFRQHYTVKNEDQMKELDQMLAGCGEHVRFMFGFIPSETDSSCTIYINIFNF